VRASRAALVVQAGSPVTSTLASPLMPDARL
jgi:hypothetical protein